MPELTREEKLKLLEKLSPHLQELMTSEDTGATLLYLGQKYHLSDHQVRLLSKILGDVVLGILPAANLSLEISTKAAVDIQTAGSLAQDLNDLIISPKPEVAVPTPAPLPALPTRQEMAVGTPTPAERGVGAVPIQPLSDKYREPTVVSPSTSLRAGIIKPTTGPEIIDLRKTPPPPMPMPVAPAPIPPSVSHVEPPMPRPAPPLTFTKPVTAPPLIEADPHRTPALTPTPSLVPKADTYREPVEQQPPASINNLPIMDAKPKEPQPQYIMRPSGLPPTDFPRDVLDLRKDKGEF